jgi:TolA-binding protein
MNFFKTHQKAIGIGLGTFVIGFISGQVFEANSFQNEMAKNIFNQVQSQQKALSSKGDDLEASNRRYEEKKEKAKQEEILAALQRIESTNAGLQQQINEMKAAEKKPSSQDPEVPMNPESLPKVQENGPLVKLYKPMKT